jgi:predicted permease
VRTVLKLQGTNLGFNPKNLLHFTLRPGQSSRSGDQLIQFYRDAFSRLDAIPGVRSATFARVPLVAFHVNNGEIILPGELQQSAGHNTNFQIIRENYLETMEIPLLRGRQFTSRDDAAGPRVALINQNFAEAYFPEQDPLGKQVSLAGKDPRPATIIGVVGDTKYSSQRDQLEPIFYTCWLQEPQVIQSMCFALRTAGDPASLAASVREAVKEVDPGLPVTDIKTQMAQADETLTHERTFAKLLSLFGGIALVLAAIGLYGVLAYSVTQRTGEIGIRIALGARTGNVLRMVIWQGMKLVIVGLVAGALGSFAAKKVVASQLYGVGPSDPVTLAGVAILLAAVAVLACVVPARRAASVDPVTALRYE